MNEEHNYTLEELKGTLKRAGLPAYMRHEVYINLPAKAEPKPPVLTRPGRRVLFTPEEGKPSQQAIVAACTARPRYRKHRSVTIWLSIEGHTTMVTYGDPRLTDIMGNVIEGVEE